MKWIAALVVFGSVLGAEPETRAVLSVTAVRHWSLPDVTRVAIEVSGSFQFRKRTPAQPRTDLLRYSELPPAHRTQKLVYRIPGRPPAQAHPGGRNHAGRFPRGTRPGRRRGNKLFTAFQSRPPDGGASRRAGVKPASGDPHTGSRDHNRGSPSAARNPPPAVASPVPVAAKVEPPKFDPPALSKPPAPVSAPPSTETVEPEMGKAARHTSGGDTSLVRALGLKLGRVVIDPGHGGHDQGTQSAHGLLEKDLVLDIAIRTGKLIEEQLGAEVTYTRSDDTFVPLEGRTALANDRKADLFLWIHANSSPVLRIAGVRPITSIFPIPRMPPTWPRGKMPPRKSRSSSFATSSRRSLCTTKPKSRASSPGACRLRYSPFPSQHSGPEGPRCQEGSIRSPDWRQHALGAGGDRVPEQPPRGSAAEEERLSPEAGRRTLSRHRKYADGLSHFQIAQNHSN